MPNDLGPQHDLTTSDRSRTFVETICVCALTGRGVGGVNHWLYFTP